MRFKLGEDILAELVAGVAGNWLIWLIKLVTPLNWLAAVHVLFNVRKGTEDVNIPLSTQLPLASIDTRSFTTKVPVQENSFVPVLP